jgi:sulfide:quinone oxidoreductase
VAFSPRSTSSPPTEAEHGNGDLRAFTTARRSTTDAHEAARDDPPCEVSRGSTTRTSAQVIIVGGGFAALEAAIALRALAQTRVRLRLVSPSTSFIYRPAATWEPLTEPRPSRYDLGKIAADLGATHHCSTLEAVAPGEQWVRLKTGTKLDYDYLVLAVGARSTTAIPGALTFRDQRDLSRLKLVLKQLAAGAIRRVVFAVPSHNTWSLPVYELAFMSEAYAAKQGANSEIAICTPERAPLAIFGPHGSQLVAGLLRERGITFIGGATPHSVRRDGSLALQFDAPIAADRVVALPELQGRRIAGIPSNWSGFVATDSMGRVEGLADVFAAGDVTTYPIKQGGLATQQADRVAHTIAAERGAPVKELRWTGVLRARLVHGEGAVVLRTEVDALGQPIGTTVDHEELRHAPDLKVFGQYLTPYLSSYRSRLEAVA